MSELLLTPDGEEVDNPNWLEDPEYSREVEPILGLVFETHDIKMDPTLNSEQQLANQDIGLLHVDWWKWDVSLNWSTQWNEGIPPHHFRVKFNKEVVGVLSPYFLVRVCPHCRLGDPAGRGGKFHPERMYVKSVHPSADRYLPWVMPAHRCRGPLYEGKLLGTCGHFDWEASMLEREHLQVSAAEELARISNLDHLATDMAVRDDPDSLGLASPASDE